MNRQSLRNAILTFTNRTDKQSVADMAIDLCMTRLGQIRDWQQTLLDVSLPISAGDSFVVLPDGTMRIMEIRLINGTMSYPLSMLEKAEVVRRVPNAPAYPQGFPRYCYRQTDDSNNDTLVFVPLSNGSYAIEMTIVQNPFIGPEDPDESNVPGLDDAVIAFGSWYVFKSIAEWDQAQQQKASFDEAVALAERSDARRPGTRHVYQQHGTRGSIYDRSYSGDPQHDPFVQRWP